MKKDTLSPRQVAGQRLMVGFEGTELNRELKHLIREFRVGGIILFAINLDSPGQIKKLCDDAQAYARASDQPPLLIAIDQEGGQVARLKAPDFTCFEGNPAMVSVDDAIEFARITARELLGVGINMNMAPVLDVPDPAVDSVMKRRAFGADPNWVATMGKAVIQTFQDNDIMAVAKHFPGIGRTVLDSHIDTPYLDVSASELESIDLQPFATAIQGQVAGIMLSHIHYTQIDPDLPASLSRRIVMDLLRNQMGYQGVVMTDDLDMGSIRKHYPIQQSICHILDAEVDMALICHKGPDIETAFKTICDWDDNSMENQRSAMRSLDRLLNLKKRFGLFRTG